MNKFSIIIPNYNKGDYIKECLDSIFNQDIEKDKYEVIVIDDGSTDNSVNIIKQFPVKFFQTNRKGAGGARNVGIDNATGEYILFLDSDDFIANDKVLSSLDKVANGQDVIFLSYIRNEFGNIFLMKDEKNSISEKIENTKFLSGPTKCYKRTIIDNTRFTEYTTYEDVNFTLECLCKCKTFDYLDEPYFTYRRVKNSNTTQEVSGKIMTDLIIEISKLYYLCFKYPQYKINLLNRIKRDKLRLRLDLLDDLIENDNNNFRKYF